MWCYQQNWDKVCNFEVWSSYCGENELLELSFVDTELYLIKVLQSNSTSTTFDKLRYELYCKKSKTLYDLLLTSRSLQGHLERCYYVISEVLNLISKAKSLEPTVHGWESFEAYLIPSKRKITLYDCMRM